MQPFVRTLARAGLLLCLAAPALAAAPLQIRQVGTPIRLDQAMVWDSRRGEALMLGGLHESLEGVPDVWRLVRSQRSHWQPVEVAGTPPPTMRGLAAVYDSLRDRVLCFGGGTLGGLGHAELWALELSGAPTWRQLSTVGPQPRQRFHARMIIDVRDRLIVYGGDGYNSIDPLVWALPLSATTLIWEPVITPDPGPGPRERHGMVYSRITDRVTVFGGDRFLPNGYFEPQYELCDRTTWELAFSPSPHWIARAGAPADSVPEASNACALVADPQGEYAWFIPGEQASGVNDPSVWRLDLRTSLWSRMAPSGISPGSRVLAGACFDPVRRQVLVQGGGSRRRFEVTGTVWSAFDARLGSALGWGLSTLGNESWQRIVDAPRIADGIVHFDPATNRLYQWTPEGIVSCDAAKGDWARDAGSVFPFLPPLRTATALDLVRHWMIVLWQGDDGSLRVWHHPLDSADIWRSAAVEDDINDPVVLPPDARLLHDEKRDELVLMPFGQQVARRLQTIERPYTFPLVRSRGIAPPRLIRFDPSYVLDRARDRVVVTGGSGFSSADRSVIAIPLGADSLLYLLSDPIDTPFGGVLVGAYWDESLDRLVVIGGQSGQSFDLGPFQHTHALSLGAGGGWQDLDPDGTRSLAGAVQAFFDPIRQQAVLWQGSVWTASWSVGTPTAFGAGEARTDSGHVRIIWQGDEVTPYAARIERSDDGGRTWGFVGSAMPDASGRLVATDTTATGASAVYRAVISRGGNDRVLGTASLGTAATPLGQPVARFALAPIRPNPARDLVTVELALPADAEVTLQVFDLSGRRVGEPWRRTLSAGRASLPVSLAKGLRPGLYLVRASDGAHDSNARLVVTR